MILYLMRHGIAEEFAPGEMKSDADRRLTKEGKERMEAQAVGVAKLDLGVTRLVSSPYIRARQTGDIVAKALGKNVEVSSELVPHADPDAFLLELGAHNTDECVMAFSHEPLVSSITSLVLSGRQDLIIEVKKGALVGLEISRLAAPFRGALKCLLTPRALRKIGGA